MINNSILINIDKPTPGTDIISTPEIIQSRFFVVDVAAITEGVQLTEGGGEGAGGGERFTPSVIDVGYDFGAGAVNEGDDITMEIVDVGILGGGGAVIPFRDTALFAVHSVFPARKKRSVPNVKSPGSVRCREKIVKRMISEMA